MIEIQNLSAAQDTTAVFSGLNLSLNLGETISLLGPNGCGKTTLMRTILGLHPKTHGEILIQNQPSNALTDQQKARLLSYVPQYHRLAFGYPVIELVLMGVLAGKSEWARPTKVQIEQAQYALEQLNISALRDKPYTHLSGGQRQLVLIARALAQNTPYLFLDEPTNGLDYGNQIKLLEKIENLAAHHRCILMTTHHPEHALSIANRVITMQNGQLTHDGHAKEVITPNHMAKLYDLKSEQLGKLFD